VNTEAIPGGTRASRLGPRLLRWYEELSCRGTCGINTKNLKNSIY